VFVDIDIDEAAAEYALTRTLTGCSQCSNTPHTIAATCLLAVHGDAQDAAVQGLEDAVGWCRLTLLDPR